MTKIAINGLGRLGRNILRLAIMRCDVEIIALHDIAQGAMIAHLLEFDSVHKSGIKNATFTQITESKGFLEFEYENLKHKITLFVNVPRDELDFSNADVVIESSGKFLDSQSVQMHIKKGAKKVIISAPSTDETPMFVLGANAHNYKNQNIISNASCTSNALAVIARVLDSEFGIESGVLTTIHSYTYDQNLLDNAHKSDLRRARAAAVNIIPTSTGAARSLYRILPSLKGRLHGHSVRVPVSDVSMVDFSVQLKGAPSTDSVNEALKNAADSELKGILGIDEKKLVSSDFIGSSFSAIVASDLTFTLENGLTKIMAWYDNESGYSHRLLDMAKFINK